MKIRKIPVILGPTCVGKTDLALKIAKETNANIISIDSRQVFEGLDIGTGKIKSNSFVSKSPFVWLVDGVKIFGYDVLKPNEEINVVKFCELIKNILEEFHKERFIITCGTGFYLNFLMGNIEYSKINSERKEELNNLSKEELLQIYQNFNDEKVIDTNNKLRIITRILSLENTGKKKKFKVKNTEFEVYFLTEERDTLYDRADEFIDDIFFKNVVGEYLDTLNLYGDVRALNGLIYSEIGNYLHQRITYEELIIKCKYDMHAYIRRQLTYFNKINHKLKTNDRDLIFSEIIKCYNS